MQTPGTYISAVGHVGLIGWLLLGWGMQSTPLPVQVMDVSIMSGEEFEQMMAARTPEPGDAPPTAPVQPVIEETPPPPVVETPPEPAPQPAPVEPPVVETPPPPVPETPPADVPDTAPVAPEPPAAPAPAPDLPPSDDPTEAPANRVASTPTAPPPQDAQISDIAREAVVPDESTSAEVVVPEQQATAPEQTATEIVIADERPRGAVDTSLRPVARPARPVPPVPAPQQETATAEPTPTPAPTPVPVPDTSDAVADALAAAVASSSAPAVPAGPPMTGSERDSFRIAVNSCWNVDPGSVAARVTVEVGFTLNRDGTVDGEPRLLSSSGDQSAINTAFEAARRAILRCQRGGYQLPADKYDQWREVVITFDPSGMRLR
ncbi:MULTISPECIES: energy transducer TonB [unclassified Yoonia]|uniref:energy transducer TonB family protein n=1 Tax=unclassified Yoonia TaxID=2629118 RepID=UPI002AFEC3A6|nr:MULTISPECIES: energy transducer TonB [unclassified Yoonia]